MWTDESIKKFWEHNESRFAGDTTAPTIIRLSRRYVRERVLDVGSGSGALLRLLPESSVGLDIVPRAPEIVRGSIDHLPFDDGAFNTVFATDILEHLQVETLAKGVQEMHRVLAVGGKLIAVIPNRENLADNSVFCPECGSTFHRWGHLTSFDEARVYHLLIRFKRVDVTPMPLRLMAENGIARRLWRVLLLTKVISPSDLFIVATR